MSFLLTQTPAALYYSLVLVALIGGYLSGSVPYGLILGKLAGVPTGRVVLQRSILGG